MSCNFLTLDTFYASFRVQICTTDVCWQLEGKSGMSYWWDYAAVQMMQSHQEAGEMWIPPFSSLYYGRKKVFSQEGDHCSQQSAFVKKIILTTVTAIRQKREIISAICAFLTSSTCGVSLWAVYVHLHSLGIYTYSLYVQYFHISDINYTKASLIWS